MRESLAQVHVHELPSSGEILPVAANDNAAEAVPAPEPLPVAANDNEATPVDMRALAETRARLGLETDLAEVVHPSPEIKNEPEESTLIMPEASAEYARTESAEGQVRAAQASGGSSNSEDGSGGGSRESSIVELSRRESGKGEKKGPGILKRILLAPVWIFGALFALAMNGVIKITNKVLDSVKLTKGGGAKSGRGNKPAGGGGHH